MFAASGEFVPLNSTSQGATLYHPLNTQGEHIRLLKILPGKQSSDIRCHLETQSLENVSLAYQKFLSEQGHTCPRTSTLIERWTENRFSPALAKLEPMKRINSTQPSAQLHRFAWGDFAALSYVWGRKSDTRRIFVNNQAVRITANLERALREFRSAGEFSGRFRLWVDALSINQKDLEERASQIQRMPNIYGVAWSVIADLGRASGGSTLALRLVQDLAMFKEASCESELEGMLREDPRFLGTMNWLGLHELMDRPYWYRLWIIQEVVMGGNRVWIRCGDSVLDWPTFCTGIGVLQEHLWLVKDQCLRNDITAATARTAPAWSTVSLHIVYRDLSRLINRTSSTDNDKLSFGRLLDLACWSDASDPRDKVYALIGLMSPLAAKLLQADYTLPVADVYMRAMKAFIQALDSLDPLREANPWGPTDCPSWVADWRWHGRGHLTRIDAPLWGPGYLFARKSDNSDYVPYSASGSIQPGTVFLDDSLLSCRGFVIDVISGLSARGVEYFSWDHNSVVSPDKFRSVYGSHGATAEAISRILIADRDAYGQKSAARHAAILRLPSTFDYAEPQFTDRGWKWLAGQEGYYFRWELFRESNRDFRLGETFFNDFFEDEIAPEALEYDVTETYVCFDRSSQKRRFMTTEGGYLGWAPDNIHGGPKEQTQVGDLIVILFGCTTPIVIRPQGESYQVLGEAYVQGMMDGQAIEGLDRGRYLPSTFTFC